MPVSTDGVLLGAWALNPYGLKGTSESKSTSEAKETSVPNEQPRAILDIGTGTGLLTLMMAQRFARADLHAIDIEQTAIDAAQHNFAQSPWGERLTLHSGSVLTYSFPMLFDHIVCNPPYFNNGEQTQNHQRATARHSDQLPHGALIDCCAQWLTTRGKASFILPIVEGRAFIEQAEQKGLYLSRYCEVSPSERKPVHRILFELSKQPSPLHTDALIIHHNNGYSDAFTALTHDFYLKM